MHPEAAAWDVVFDARGHLTEPHTKKTVPLGTLEVRRYLREMERHEVTDPVLTLPDTTAYPTSGPAERFGAILFIEKEGFLPLFERVHLAERYDLAIMSTKGLSVTASRQLVDELCGEEGVPLLVLHDFDKAGFSILATLQRDTRRYEFTNAIQVIDLGFRLADIRAHHLAAETVSYPPKSDPRPNLRENGATQEESAFLCSAGDWRSGYAGQRVELNAFTSDQLVAWLEGKLAKHGVTKVIPDAETLKAAYRRALWAATLQARVEAMMEKAKEKAEAAPIPRALARTVRKRLAADRAIPWDRVVAELASRAVDDLDEGEDAELATRLDGDEG